MTNLDMAMKDVDISITTNIRIVKAIFCHISIVYHTEKEQKKAAF